jgi:formylglycine-generating enzyme required for sulfatase activity
VAKALSYAHSQGQIHRDLKPSNIMIDAGGNVCLIDFGLTRAITPDATRHRCGTLRYMSPEQLDLRVLDGRTDIYSLGVTLYETIAPELPFGGVDESAVAEQIRTGAVTPLELAVPGIPERLASCIRRAMHPRADARYGTAEDLAEELAACQREAEEEAARSPRRFRLGARQWALAGLLALAASLTAIWALRSGGVDEFNDQRVGNQRMSVAPDKVAPSAEPTVAVIENSLRMKLVEIPPGSFWMGSFPTEEEATPLEFPRHQVHITKPFLLGVYEVTQVEYAAVMARNPSRFNAEELKVEDSGHYPVDSVSWLDAQEFCRRLSARPAERAAGRRYRLPTEAQWEYACRAGSLGPFSYGNSLSSAQANVNGEQPYGGAARHLNRSQPTPVGSFEANEFGLYDMHGNVLEWCEDCCSDYTALQQHDPLAVADQPDTHRIMRGGGSHSPAAGSRSARRYSFHPSERHFTYGFRVACDVAGE